MDQPRRFIFHGNASAVGGRILHPKDIVIETAGGSSLPTVGGRSTSQMAGRQYGKQVSFGSASTFAEGLFDDFGLAVKANRGYIPEDTLVATTRVKAEVLDLKIGDGPLLTAKRVSMSLQARSPLGSGQPSIWPVDADRETEIRGVEVDGYKLVVTLNAAPFQECDTHAKLLAAADDAKFLARHGACLFAPPEAKGSATALAARLARSPVIQATIVKSIRWNGKPYPGSRILGTMVVIPNYGRVFFGELLIAKTSRRLTMLRARLGSPARGDVEAGGGEANGSWG